MRRFSLILLVLLPVVAAAIWLVGTIIRPTALVVPVVRGKAVHAVPGTVSVRAEFVIEIKSEVAGRIVQSALEVGRTFDEGDVLFQLDTTTVDLEIERLGHEIAAARRRVEVGSTSRAELANTREAVAHLERQVKAGTYPQVEYDKAVRSLEQLAQRVELEEVNLRLALQNLETSLRTREREREKMTLRSPARGTVNEILARKGDLIAGNAPVAVLISDTRIVEAKLSEENLASVRVGQRASIRFLTYGGHQFDGTVAKILPAADHETQRYTLWLDVKLPDSHSLLPGLTGEVSIIIDSRSNALIIPRRALLRNQVMLVRDGRIAMQPVETGYESLNDLEVLNGLVEGDLVVVEALDTFREGERVRVQRLDAAR